MNIDFNINLELLLISIFLIGTGYFFILKSCTKVSLVEGFTLINKKITNNDGIFDFLSDVPFLSKCCKSHSYSTSKGCACLSQDHINFLKKRGGNNYLEQGDDTRGGNNYL